MLQSTSFAQLSHFHSTAHFLPWSATLTYFGLFCGFLPFCGKILGQMGPLSTHNLSFPKFVAVSPKNATSCLPNFFTLDSTVARLMTLQSMRHRKMVSLPTSPISCNCLTLGNHRTQKMTKFIASNILFCE